MTAPLIISYYTNDWVYPEHADRFIKECQQFGLDHHVVKKPTTNNYIRNTAIKPFFIRECLINFKRPVFWVDVDAIILQPVIEPPDVFDIAACKYLNSNLNRTWAVASLWFNYTPAALAFLDEWCNRAELGTDEAAFDSAWQAIGSQVKIGVLPETYHFVKWSHRLEIPDNTVICHQLSKSEDKMRRKEKPNNA